VGAKALVRCKVCGYVMEADKLGDVCPACGVSRKVFEPYEDRVEPWRRFYLTLDLHPVIVHAPQALTFLLLPLSLLLWRGPEAWRSALDGAVTVMCLLLPPTALGAFASGLVDGRIRYRKWQTPLLVRKIVLGVVFMALTCAMLALALPAASRPARLPWFFAANVAAFAVCTWLGIIGSKLLQGVFMKPAPRPAAKPSAAAGAPPAAAA